MRFICTGVFLFSWVSGYSQAYTILKKVDSLISVANYEMAIDWLDLNPPDPKNHNEIAAHQNKKIEILLTQGQLEKAELLLGQVKTTDEFLQALTLSNIGYLNLNKGRYDLALENLQKAFSTFRVSEKASPLQLIQSFSRLASVYVATGKYTQAEEFESMALQLSEKTFGNNSEEVAASFNNLGLIYSASANTEKSLDFYSKALNTYERLYNQDHPKIAISNTNLGITNVQLELYGDAINNFKEALATWGKIYPSGHPNVAFVLQNLGYAYAKLQDQVAAIEYYQQAASLYQKAYGTKHPDISRTLNGLGTVYLNAGQYEQAITTFQKSIIANATFFDEEDIRKNPSGFNCYNPIVLVLSLTLKAQSLEAKYIAKTLRLEDLKLALRCLYTCDSLIEEIRHQSTAEEDKLTLGNVASTVYENGVRIAFTISENVLDAKPYWERAFYFAEKSKSAVLQESIADAQAKEFAGIPNELLEQEKRIKSTITQLSQELSQKPVEDQETLLRQQLFDANRGYYEFVKKLESDYPNYYQLKFSKQTSTVEDIKQALPEEIAAISYFIADQTKTLYAFVVTKNDFKVITTSLPKDFNRLLRGFANALFFSEPVTFSYTSSQLYSLLIPRLPSRISQLVIIPSGRLSALPFEVLLSEKMKGFDFSKAAYLIAKYAVSYEFSSQLLIRNIQTNNSTKSSIFLCAPIIFEEVDNLSNLPSTQQEVTSIADLFKDNSKIITFNNATESHVKLKELSAYSYLHFATHGIVDEINPELSRLFLKASQQDDGYLYAGEIYNLSLNANLVVLSACQTGLGKFSKGEGVIGLSRALMYAGAQNSIVSFWNVADASTAELMIHFYTVHINANQKSISQSLRDSKLKMLQSEKYFEPYYWAPFVLIGR
jgi:CHAT domain-containing protein/TPR repeat protein